MNADRTAPMAADSSRSQASENGVSRRDTLMFAAVGLTAPSAPNILIRRNQEGGKSHELHQSRTGKLTTHRDLLRGPRLRIASRAHSWLAVERRRVGEADRRAARSRPSRDHI